MKSISIVIPTFEEGDWLKTTVDSCITETDYDNFEIIVVNDAGKDDSCDFLQTPEYGYIRFVDSAEKIGLARAKNLGAEHAKGELIVFIDSHMVPKTRNWLQEIERILAPDNIGAGTIIISTYEEPEKTAPYYYTIGDYMLEPDWIAFEDTSQPDYTPVLPGGCFAVKKEVFAQVEGFDSGLKRWGREDLELSLKIWRSGFDMVSSPHADIAHAFERKRPFTPNWEEVGYNLLRVADILMNDEHRERVLEAMEEELGTELRDSIQATIEDTSNKEYQQYKKQTQQRFTRSFEEYIQQFEPLLPFLQK